MLEWLETALYCGIPEQDFWSMSIPELNRAIKVKTKLIKDEERRKASFDYTLASLIGTAVGRAFSGKGKFPEIYNAYPDLFDEEEVQVARAKAQEQAFAAQLRQFADFHNSKKEVAK